MSVLCLSISRKPERFDWHRLSFQTIAAERRLESERMYNEEEKKKKEDAQERKKASEETAVTRPDWKTLRCPHAGALRSFLVGQVYKYERYRLTVTDTGLVIGMPRQDREVESILRERMERANGPLYYDSQPHLNLLLRLLDLKLNPDLY